MIFMKRGKTGFRRVAITGKCGHTSGMATVAGSCGAGWKSGGSDDDESSSLDECSGLLLKNVRETNTIGRRRRTPKPSATALAAAKRPDKCRQSMVPNVRCGLTLTVAAACKVMCADDDS